MDMTAPDARPSAPPLLLALAGAALLALAFYASGSGSSADRRGGARRGGARRLAPAFAQRPFSNLVIGFDAAAFAVFALMRNDAQGFWLLPGPWLDAARFDTPGAVIALIVYSGGAILALIGGYRGLRVIEAFSLLAIPFLFNLLLVLGADWHMADIGGLRHKARRPALHRASRDWARADIMVSRPRF